MQAKYDLMKPTNMVNYVLDLKRELEGSNEGEEVPEGSFPQSFFCAISCLLGTALGERVSFTRATPNTVAWLRSIAGCTLKP